MVTGFQIQQSRSPIQAPQTHHCLLALILIVGAGCMDPVSDSNPNDASMDMMTEVSPDACGPDVSNCDEVDEGVGRCNDDKINGDETDVDCGGSCNPCEEDQICAEDSDCALEICRDGLCAGPQCGDGTVHDPEQCDDGNTVDGDGCSSTCVTEGCGNGIIEEGEGDCDCPEGFRNTDGDTANACECEVLAENDESCNGIDDDCDGTADEDFADDRPLFGECVSVEPACGSAGSRDRNEWICVEGELVESASDEECVANTDGALVEEGDWGECQPGPDGCSLLGSQTRTITTCLDGGETANEETQECQLAEFPDCGDPISQGWLQYHTQVESCFPNYNGPVVSRFSVGDETFPRCDDQFRGQAWCAERDDGSPSRCLFCEENLFICQ